jgi:transposase
MRRKITTLQEAFTGYFTGHHAFLLATMLARVDAIGAGIAALGASIAQLAAPFAAEVRRLAEIPGISFTAACAILAETGTAMDRFPTAGRLVSWAKFAPGVKESAGKKKGKGTTGHGNRYLARVLGNAAASIARTDTFLGERYRRIARRRGSQKAVVAIGRSLLVIIWHLLADPTARYTDLGSDFYDTRSTPNAASAPTSASSKPSVTRSPSNPRPDHYRQPSPAPLTLRRALPRAH